MRSRVSSFSQLIVPTMFLMPLLSLGCTAGLTGDVTKVISQADRSDPVRAAIVEVLAVADQDFVPILAGPLNETERAAMIKSGMGFTAMGDAMSSMDMLRVAENAADSARHVSVTMPGAETIYYAQDIVSGGVSGIQKFVEFRFDGPFEERKQVAADLTARIAPLFAVDPKWYTSSNFDKELNPVSGNTSFLVYVSMGLDASSEIIMVSIDYWHDREVHEASGGVRVYVSRMFSGVN
jgi:hypothetical protein